MPDVSQERTGWRDSALSERHRAWGLDCPALDMDFIMLEYDHGKATAIVEYKNERAAPQHKTHPSYRALIDMGNRAGLPVFACRYATDFSWFTVVPLNAKACELIGNRKSMTELEWVETLYQTRGYPLPDDIREALGKDDSTW